jgi:hypothetical protein
LIKNQGWRGVLIEGNRERFEDLTRTYAGDDRANLVCAAVGLEPGTDLLDDILASVAGCPNDIDFLSIDIDGNDYHIFASLATFKPRVVVIEFNPTIPNDVVFVQDRDFSVNQACSLLALVELGKSKGYELVAATSFNAFLVVADAFPKFGIADNSIDAMYAPLCDGRVFHGYDGTIYCAGMDVLLWHGIEVAPGSLQILPAEKRVYSDRLPGAPLAVGA